MFMRPAFWLGIGALLVLAWLATRGWAPASELVAVSVKSPPPTPLSVASAVGQAATKLKPPLVFVPSDEAANANRRRLYDSPNVLDAVNRVLATGSPDEKGWAAELMRECYRHVDKEQQVYQSTELPAIEAQRMAAFETLQKRCEGVGQLDWPTRRAMTSELLAAAGKSTSAFHALRVLQDRQKTGDTRWNQTESRLVADGLYGEDPLIRREAFLALLTAIDKNAPGGTERSEGLLFALAEQVLNPPLSEFERLLQCTVAAVCGRTDPAPAAVPGRLQILYLDAFAQRRPPEEILAIR